MLRDELQTSFRALLQETGLLAHYDALLPEARECLRFSCREVERSLPPGASKFGGLPDLPDSVEWPIRRHTDSGAPWPAEFLAQFNLAELPPIIGLDLPRSGYLWLFDQAGGVGSASDAVFYRDGPEPLRSRAKPGLNGPRPTWDPGVLKTAAFTFQMSVSLPWSSRIFDRKFASFASALHPLLLALEGSEGGFDGQIGGHSYQQEVDVCREYAMYELGRPECAGADHWASEEELEWAILRGNPFRKDDEAFRVRLHNKIPQLRWILENEHRIAPLAESLQVICRFDRTRGNGRVFGDGMHLEFLMYRADLAMRDFSKVYCALPMLL